MISSVAEAVRFKAVLNGYSATQGPLDESFEPFTVKQISIAALRSALLSQDG